MQKQESVAVCSLPEIRIWLEEAASNGEGYAHWKLAMAHLDGTFGERSLPLAAQHLRAAIKCDIAFAPYALVQLIQSGLVDLEPSEDLHDILLTGAVLGHTQAMREMAKIYMIRGMNNASELFGAQELLKRLEWSGCQTSGAERRYIDAFGHGVGPSRGEAQLFARRRGLEGHAKALLCFGYMTYHGYSGPSQVEQAFTIWEEALDLGCHEAAIDIYSHAPYHSEYTIPEQAKASLERLIQKGHPEAHYLMAKRWLNSDEPMTQSLARSYLERAMRYEHAPSLLLLAQIDWDLSNEKQIQKSIHLCQTAMGKGMTTAGESQLGEWAHEIMKSQEKVYPELLKYVEKVAETDFTFAIHAAFYYNGKYGSSKNAKKEIFWLCAAMLDGHSEASRILALHMQTEAAEDQRKGELVLPLLINSATMDNSYSCALLGDLYKDGDGSIIRNPMESAFWYHKGAKLGYPYCQSKLAWCYANGFGVAKDMDKATFWDDIAEGRIDFETQNKFPSFETFVTPIETSDLESVSNVLPLKQTI